MIKFGVPNYFVKSINSAEVLWLNPSNTNLTLFPLLSSCLIWLTIDFSTSERGTSPSKGSSSVPKLALI